MVVHLQTVDLFAYCTAEQMVRMASIARVRPFRAGDRLYVVDDPPEGLFCLVEGKVELRPPTALPDVAVANGLDASEPAAPSSAFGPDAAPRIVEPPASFGVREILGDEPRLRSAEALSDGLALYFDADDLFDLLSNNIEIVKALFRQLLRSPRPVSALGSGRGLANPGRHGESIGPVARAEARRGAHGVRS